MQQLPIRLAAGSGPTFGVDDLACAAATHLGFWSDQGLDVSWTPVRGGVAAIQAVMDGTVDVSYGGLGPVLKSRAEGKPVRVIVSMARALAQNLVAQAAIKDTSQLREVSWSVDGIGALSHHMARLIVRALNIPEADVDWRVSGPPPERIAALLDSSVDVALLRVEEALALSLDKTNALHTLLGFAELKRLVPIQPHGALTARQDYVDSHPDELERLAKGIILASRALNDDFKAFETTYRHYVKVSIPDEQVKAIWEQERLSNGFALNGELSRTHWQAQIDSFAALHPALRRVAFDEVIDRTFVARALESVGVRTEQEAPLERV
jgi:ABC-type nitrate/sulfonate/bicarbonate transport system substrate-binding protein